MEHMVHMHTYAQEMHVGTSLYSRVKSLCTYANYFTSQQL